MSPAKIFASVGALKPFYCTYCLDRDNFVSGPHSHVCGKCGSPAVYGWYTTPLCEKCHKDEQP